MLFCKLVVGLHFSICSMSTSCFPSSLVFSIFHPCSVLLLPCSSSVTPAYSTLSVRCSVTKFHMVLHHVCLLLLLLQSRYSAQFKQAQTMSESKALWASSSPGSIIMHTGRLSLPSTLSDQSAYNAVCGYSQVDAFGYWCIKSRTM